MKTFLIVLAALAAYSIIRVSLLATARYYLRAQAAKVNRERAKRAAEDLALYLAGCRAAWAQASQAKHKPNFKKGGNV